MNKYQWEKYYKKTPLAKIFWQETQADYLKELIRASKVKPGKALDLGCGTGIKSIFLVKNGFSVTGIDISETAINYAKENAKKENINIDFFVHDATDLRFLKDKKFDLVLDWANLHGVPSEKVEKYILGITDHLKIGGKLILRCFGRKESEEKYVKRPDFIISLYTDKEIEDLFGENFKVLEKNISKSENDKAPGKFFYEFLLERK